MQKFEKEINIAPGKIAGGIFVAKTADQNIIIFLGTSPEDIAAAARLDILSAIEIGKNLIELSLEAMKTNLVSVSGDISKKGLGQAIADILQNKVPEEKQN